LEFKLTFVILILVVAAVVTSGCSNSGLNSPNVKPADEKKINLQRMTPQELEKLTHKK
jgi:PBP1b-binding outer membrane lipoprotein LpoB